MKYWRGFRKVNDGPLRPRASHKNFIKNWPLPMVFLLLSSLSVLFPVRKDPVILYKPLNSSIHTLNRVVLFAFKNKLIPHFKAPEKLHFKAWVFLNNHKYSRLSKQQSKFKKHLIYWEFTTQKWSLSVSSDCVGVVSVAVTEQKNLYQISNIAKLWLVHGSTWLNFFQMILAHFKPEETFE